MRPTVAPGAKTISNSAPFFCAFGSDAVRTAPPPGKGAGGYSERALYVAKGEIEVGDRTFHEGQMIVLKPAAEPTIKAIRASTVMVLGGEPIGPRVIWWNFVSSSQAKIDAAKADWKAGRMALPVEDDVEFIPLPDVPATPEPAPAGAKPEPTHPV